MAEFEIIGENEEMDEATRAFLEQEQDQLAGLGHPIENAIPPEELPAVENNATNPFASDILEAEDNQDKQENVWGTPAMDDVPPPPPEEEVDQYAAVSFADVQMNEPEPVRQWREEQVARLAEKDARSVETLAAMRAKAKEDLEAFYRNYHNQQQAASEANRAEQGGADGMVADKPVDWEAVLGMCDFNPKTAKGQKDTSRMRSILLQLKQSPPVR